MDNPRPLPRELRFHLWELNHGARRLQAGWHGQRDPAAIDALLRRARDFALEMGRCNQSADRQGCHLSDEGEVRLPQEYAALWERFRAEWAPLLAGPERGPPHDSEALAPFVMQLVYEMFMGANPAFMTYASFNRPAVRLLRRHGTAKQSAFMDRLSAHAWDACFCATERRAGSDLTAVQTLGTALGEGVYAIQGEKLYISAGRHDLTANTLYFVLGRIGAAADALSLSCFIAPRYWPNDATGELEPNHVECVGLANKMGLKGCANTQLRFGHRGVTRAWLLGDRRNVGLLQLMPLMNMARTGTATYAVGVAWNAYLQAAAYARHRVQGRSIERASDASAPRVRIIEHADVQRMLLEMKSRVEGCRGLLGRLTCAATDAEILERAPVRDPEAIERCHKLQQLLTPICKAFISDQAWLVCTLAIQVHGGLGYTDGSPVEQATRDVKVLSIWEGTNYVQAQDLVRDKLGFGQEPKLMRYFHKALEDGLGAFDAEARDPAMAPWFAQLRGAAEMLDRALASIGAAVRGGRMHESSQFFTRFLEMFGTTIAAWSLLEAACLAQRRLENPAVLADPAESAFYRGKLKSARFYFGNLLPLARCHGQVLEAMSMSACAVTPDELAEPQVDGASAGSNQPEERPTP